MPRIVVDPRNVHDGAITVTDPAVLHHVLDVLRVRAGSALDCMDGTGTWYAARVVHCSRRGLELHILNQGREPGPALAIRLVQALIKPERFDWLVQKATELGVERISPVMAARSIIRLRGDRTSGRMARWRRIAAEAAQQCGRATAPHIDPPAAFGEVLASLDARMGSDPTQVVPPSLVLLPTLAVSGRSVRQAIGELGGAISAAVLIGPEGDFTTEEVALAQRHGAVPVSLGRRTLRSETAAIAVLAVLQHAAGEL